jgi:GR25 family glycosyltransferase involved in LPS biosynthesis
MAKKLPVLFLTYNRPTHTRQVLSSILEYGPSKLYISSDGPRSDDDEMKVTKVRDILNNQTYSIEVFKKYSLTNKGCAEGVRSAIDWFFQNEEEGIILEDDCLPNESFYKFCEELIEKYRSSNKVFHISGNNFQYGHQRGEADYYFSIFNHVWGWATWRRTWNLYKHNVDQIDTKKIGEFVNDDKISHYFTPIFKKTFAGEIDTWDFRYMYSCWLNNGLSIVPNKNLVSNIGFGEDATHTKATNSIQNNNAAHELTFPLSHPVTTVIHKKADRFTFKTIFIRKESFHDYILRRVKRLIGKIYTK